MWLLNTTTLRLEWHSENIPKYAILSHRWEQDEVLFKDIRDGTAPSRKGWRKVVICCAIARNARIPYAWIDTCCINKGNNNELQKAINSMYGYYERAFRCYVYLNDVQKSANTASEDEVFDEVSKSQWFTRGWTLQELIAPYDLMFYNSNWEYLWAKRAYSRQLQRITGISKKLLEGEASLQDFSLAQRMAWAASRTTTEVEDEAYSLLGLFQISMPLLYGEGDKAFLRLQQEIIKEYDDQSLFAWHDNVSHIKPVLAPSVACFRGLDDLKCYPTNDRRHGHTFSNTGLNIQLMLIPWSMGVWVAPLSCGRAIPEAQLDSEQSVRRYRRLGIFLRKTTVEDHYTRVSVDINGQLQDSIMLDSDIVAKKRQFFRISNLSVSIRQKLVSVPEQVQHSFTFSFNHPHLFRRGIMPLKGKEIKNDCYEESSTRSRYGFIHEEYSHYESAAFELNCFTARRRTLYLYLGFDLDFSPVCLITSKNVDDDHTMQTEESEGGDFNGMYRRRVRPHMTLSRLLSMIETPGMPDTLLAFKVQPGRSLKARCTEASLTIEFKLKDVRQSLPAMGVNGKMWHVRFDSTAVVSDFQPPPIRRILSAPNPQVDASPEVAVRKGLLTRFFSLKPQKRETMSWPIRNWLSSDPTERDSSDSNESDEERSPPGMRLEEVRPLRSSNIMDQGAVLTPAVGRTVRVLPDIYEAESVHHQLRPFTSPAVYELETVYRSELHQTHTRELATPQHILSGEVDQIHRSDEAEQWLKAQRWVSSPENNIPTIRISREDSMSVSRDFLIPRKSLPRSSVSSMTRDDRSPT